jgi:hypothetical protein
MSTRTAHARIARIGFDVCMMKRARVRSVGIAALAVAAAFVNATPALAAKPPKPHVVGIDPVSIEEPAAIRDLYRMSKSSKKRLVDDPTADAGCGPAATAPVPDGEPIIVSMPPADPFTVGQIPATSWRNPPSQDPTWKLNYLGLMWMKSLARRAAMDNQLQSLTDLVSQVVAFHAQNPDPTTATFGWDEGTALRRLETENCLYALSKSSRLVNGMVADANVLLGPRYYGPPNFAVHNHGLMANLRLVKAGDQLGKPAWKTTAINRMVNEAPQAFSAGGTSFEQSSMYQQTNADLWEQAAVVLEATPGQESSAATVRGLVNKAHAAFSWMTEPDGKIVQVGDSEEIAGVPAPTNDDSLRVFRDSQAGWSIGRWSWTDPNTSYYTIRYGPARRAHGHQDRAGGVTYTTKGVRVLVGPGLFTYDATSNYNSYGIGPVGQNVAIPDGGVAGAGTGAVSAYTIQAAAHAWSLTDTVYGESHTRGVNVNRDTPRMLVSDSFPSSTVWRQHWHLDPQWTLVSGGPNDTTLVFSHPSGKKLTVTTTGRVSGIQQGITNPPAGWHFPDFQVRVWAPEITIRNYGTACTTTFQVS